jgi:predicted AAA+ superfamily ATPase
MRIVERELSAGIRQASRQFEAVVLTGARRTGKTFLLRSLFPRASYHLLEDPDVLSRARQDPRGWLEEIATPAILDEIQNAPELLPYIRSMVDRNPRRAGQWFLTGSQDFSLMAGVTESMAGRAAVFHLSPFSYRETGSWDLLRGGFPEVALRRKSTRTWFNSYIQTYMERDVRSLKAVKDLSTFRRFIALLASRHGQILNRSDLAAPLGLSVPTISEWLGILQTTGHVLLVPPYFENFGKRLIKSPKVYWVDSGLVAFLLGLETRIQLERSTFIGPVFEGFIASEIVKNQANRGRPREIYFFRDEQGLEVDFLVPSAGGKLTLVEAKWTKTIQARDAVPLQRLLTAIERRPAEAVIVHRASRTGETIHAVAPRVKGVTVEELLGSKSP